MESSVRASLSDMSFGPESVANDEESFIILERETVDGIQENPPRSFLLNGSTLASQCSSSRPDQVPPVTCDQNGEVPTLTSGESVSLPSDVQRRMDSLIEDNEKLQVTVDQTNMSLRQTMGILADWRVEMENVRQDHKEKFKETRALVLKLKQDKAEMRQVIEDLQRKVEILESNSMGFSCDVPNVNEIELKTTIDKLQSQLNIVEAALHDERETSTSYKDHLKCLNDVAESRLAELDNYRDSVADCKANFEHLQKVCQENMRLKAEVQNLSSLLKQEKAEMQQVIEELQRKVEILESDSMVFTCEVPNVNEIELKTTIADLQNQLNIVEAAFQAEQEKSAEYDKQLKSQQDLMKSQQEELDTYKEIVGSNKVNLGQFQAVCEENTRLKSDVQNLSSLERHSQNYHAAQSKGFTERVDELTAKLMKAEEELHKAKGEITQLEGQRDSWNLNEDALKNAQGTEQRLRCHIDEMTATIVRLESENNRQTDEINTMHEEIVRLMRENEAVGILQAQMEVYQADFLAERACRERLAAEKEQLAEDVRRLHAHQQGANAALRQTGNEREEPTEANATNTPFRCPICENLTFRTLQSLNDHLDNCLNLA